MTCEEFNRMLDNYESLTAQEKLLMNEHAGECEKCRDELDFMLKIIKQLNTLPKMTAPDDFMDRLNERISAEDFEERRLRRMMNMLRRNYKRYSTVAACLVLAVIVGVNGKHLINNMVHDDNSGVIIESNSDGEPDLSADVTDLSADVTESGSKSDKTAVSTQPEIYEHTSQNKAVASNQIADVPNIKTAKADDKASSVSVSTAQRSISSKKTIEPIQEISESFDFIEPAQQNNRTPVLDGTILEAKTAGNVVEEPLNPAMSRMIADDTANVPAVSAYLAMSDSQEDESISKNYTIARGVYRLPDAEIAQAEFEASACSGDGVVQDFTIDEDTEITIARGRYYIPAEDGYIDISNDNAIEIYGGDADRAVELIQQYTAVKDDSYYVIDSENISPMLEHMDREGINYQNNVEDSEDKRVSFKLVIE